MPERLIVIGASSGGIEACQKLFAKLAADLRAPVLVVIHTSVNSRNLPFVLQISSALPVVPARDGEEPVPGWVYVAAPDHHLMIEGGQLRLTTGPRESRSRPSIDVLFRSAAYHFGNRAIGVLLTGMLDDGTAGLWAIKDRGGIAIVQDPSEADYPSMPANALQFVDVDYMLPLDRIPDCLRALTRTPVEMRDAMPVQNDKLKVELAIAADRPALEQGVLGLGEPSLYTCPDCEGTMIRIKEGPIERYRCHTGHAYSEQALAKNGCELAEKKLWSALAQLEAHQAILATLAKKATPGSGSEQEDYARRTLELADLIAKLRQLTHHAALTEPSEGTPHARAQPAQNE